MSTWLVVAFCALACSQNVFQHDCNVGCCHAATTITCLHGFKSGWDALSNNNFDVSEPPTLSYIMFLHLFSRRLRCACEYHMWRWRDTDCPGDCFIRVYSKTWRTASLSGQSKDWFRSSRWDVSLNTCMWSGNSEYTVKVHNSTLDPTHFTHLFLLRVDNNQLNYIANS